MNVFYMGKPKLQALFWMK